MSLGLQSRRDVDFLVKEVFNLEPLFKLPAFEDHSWETFDHIMDAAQRFANEEMASTLAEGDREGLRFEDGEVKTPACFRSVYKKYLEGGWTVIAEPPELGGIGLPRSLTVHAMSSIIGANMSLFTLPGLNHGAGEMIAKLGSQEQIDKYVPKLYEGKWGGTMCLTEPGAGSDVGALRATARKAEDGTWHITGTKIFITWGEHDLTENIIYPVLARVEGDPAGTKGISMFLVSKYKLDEKGRLGERNGVKCTGIEHKMGIHACPTCTIAFGEDEPAVGELIGERCQGMSGMFNMMNTARIAVGLQALGTAEAAYRYAQQYAIERLQGSAIEDFKNPGAPRVPIIRHPDVRRMLADMRGVVEGTRALLGFAAWYHDLAETSDPDAEDLVGLLTPLCKGYASEICYEATGQALLVLGGHGYLRDHPVEQYLRDIVIARIYEGTTGIQALDLVGRKLGGKGGLAMMRLLGEFDKAVKLAKDAGLDDLAGHVTKMRQTVGMTAMGLGQRFGGGDMQGPLLQATPMMMLLGDAVLSWLHLWMAAIAAKAPEQTRFHKNKVATARHWIVQAASRVEARAAVISGNDKSPLEIEFEGEEDL